MYIYLLMMKIVFRFLILIALGLGSTATIAKAEGGTSSCAAALGVDFKKSNEVRKELHKTESYKKYKSYYSEIKVKNLTKKLRAAIHWRNKKVIRKFIKKNNRLGNLAPYHSNGSYFHRHTKVSLEIERYLIALLNRNQDEIKKYETILSAKTEDSEESSGIQLFQDSLNMLGKRNQLREKIIEKGIAADANVNIFNDAIASLKEGQKSVILTYYSVQDLDDKLTYALMEKEFTASSLLSLKEVLVEMRDANKNVFNQRFGLASQAKKGNLENLNASIVKAKWELQILYDALTQASLGGKSLLDLMDAIDDMNIPLAEEIKKIFNAYHRLKDSDLGIKIDSDLKLAEAYLFREMINDEKHFQAYTIIDSIAIRVGLYGKFRNLYRSEALADRANGILGIERTLRSNKLAAIRLMKQVGGLATFVGLPFISGYLAISPSGEVVIEPVAQVQTMNIGTSVLSGGLPSAADIVNSKSFESLMLQYIGEIQNYGFDNLTESQTASLLVWFTQVNIELDKKLSGGATYPSLQEVQSNESYSELRDGIDVILSGLVATPAAESPQ